MIGRNYLLKQPAAPSPVKVLVDQSVIPALIDAAAAVEVQIERFGGRARRAPVLCVGVAFGLGWAASRVLRFRRSARRRYQEA
nr:hypothetical protein [uncultured Rhodopila sp.]